MTGYAAAPVDARRREAAAAHPEVAAWLRDLERKLASGTVYMRSIHADKLLAAFPDKQLNQFTEDDLLSVLRAENLNEGAQANHISSFRSLFKWATTPRPVLDETTGVVVKRPLIDVNPAEYLERPKVKQRYLEVFTDAEVEACIGLPNDPDEDTGTGEDGFRMLLMFDTGLRIGELCKLRDRDVQPDRRRVVVLGRTRGGGAKGDKDRVVPMSERLVTAYSEWRLLNGVQRDDHVFGRQYPGPKGRRRKGIKHRRDPLDVQTFRMWWYTALELAGAYREWTDNDGNLKRTTPHFTRHYLATALLRRGAHIEKVAEILGHDSVDTTRKLYSHLVTEDLFSTIDLLQPPRPRPEPSTAADDVERILEDLASGLIETGEAIRQLDLLERV